MKTLAAAIVAAGLVSGCVGQSQQSSPVTAASYCQAQGSAMAVDQCQQYYARNHVNPPQPADAYQPQQSGLDAHDRAMLIGAYLSRPQPAPSNPWASVLQPRQTTNCSSNINGNFVSTTCQ